MMPIGVEVGAANPWIAIIVITISFVAWIVRNTIYLTNWKTSVENSLKNAKDECETEIRHLKEKFEKHEHLTDRRFDGRTDEMKEIKDLIRDHHEAQLLRFSGIDQKLGKLEGALEKMNGHH